MKKSPVILLGHGSGGRLSHELIQNLFIKAFRNNVLDKQTDAAVLPFPSDKLAFTTDAFVVNPLFFPGGDIGKLAVAGTVNDLAVSGAKPLFLSASFIIEEGFPYEELEKVVNSMATEAQNAGVQIVTGDTKVVEKGKCDRLFITTSGVGAIIGGDAKNINEKEIQVGDKIIINGSIGDHGMAVMAARNELNLSAPILSDCACLHELINSITEITDEIHFMRDATRGGLGTVITEVCENQQFGALLYEETIPVSENVRGMCELLGFDPLYVANEGKVVLIVSSKDAEKVVNQLRSHPKGAAAAIIGEIVSQHPGQAWLKTAFGSTRVIDMLAGEQLPRIC